MPDFGGAFRVVRALPPNIGREILLTGDDLTADRAAALGLVNKVTPPGGALEGALDLAGRICANAPLAIRAALATSAQAARGDESQFWAFSNARHQELLASEDVAEGVAAFFQRRARSGPASNVPAGPGRAAGGAQPGEQQWVNQREQIMMSAAEVAEFLRRSRTATVASVGPGGMPHLVAMWYGLIGDAVYIETKAKSQKAVNLRRDPRMVFMVEAGTSYDTLRGVSLEGNAILIEADGDEYWAAAMNVYERYTGPYSEEARPIVEFMMNKRIVVKLVPTAPGPGITASSAWTRSARADPPRGSSAPSSARRGISGPRPAPSGLTCPFLDQRSGVTRYRATPSAGTVALMFPAGDMSKVAGPPAATDCRPQRSLPGTRAGQRAARSRPPSWRS